MQELWKFLSDYQNIVGVWHVVFNDEYRDQL